MGYNKYGGLDMTIENIPRIREEIERFEKGESSFFSRHDPKISTEVGNIRTAERKIRKRKENILPEVQAIIDSGRVTQWKKIRPFIF